MGDLEPSLQGKLLRAIEERTVRRVGGIRDRKIDVRILAATNRDLEREVAGTTASAATSISAWRSSCCTCRRCGSGVTTSCSWPSISPALQREVRQATCAGSTPGRARLLLAYPWPGNVRELSHVIERAVLWSRGDTLDVEHLSCTRLPCGWRAEMPPRRPPSRAPTLDSGT